MVTQGTGAGTPPNEIYKAALQTEYQKTGMTLWAGGCIAEVRRSV